jgi:hypothetical protein
VSGEFLISSFVPALDGEEDPATRKLSYLVDFGAVLTLRISNVNAPAHNFIYREIEPKTLTFNSVIDFDWFEGPPRFQASYRGFPGTSGHLREVTLPVSESTTTTRISAYAGGIFEKNGQDVTWSEWPPNPHPGHDYTAGGRLLWSQTLGSGASAIFNSRGIVV